MSGICPTPAKQESSTFEDDSFDIGTPSAAANDCASDTNTTLPDESTPTTESGLTEEEVLQLVEEHCCSNGMVWKGIWASGVDYKAGSPEDCGPHVVSHVAATGDDDWFDATEYVLGDGVYDMNNVHYTAIETHTSDPTTEPSVGADWGLKWRITDDLDLPHALYICIQDHTSSDTDEPQWGANEGIYWERMLRSGVGIGSTITGLNYRGKWQENGNYGKNDVLMHNNSSYVCIQSHTAVAAKDGTETNKGNEPDLSLMEGQESGLIDGIFDSITGFFGGTEYNDPSEYWELLSKGEQEDKGFLGGVFDWLGDVTGWEIFDESWFQSAASILGAGAVTYYLDEWLTQPTPQWSARFDGDTGYTGSYQRPILPDIIDSICESAGITSYDTSLLGDYPVAFTIGEITNYRSILEMLSQAYQFDIISTFDINSGRTLKFKPRSTTSVKTLSLTDIGFGNGVVGETPYQSKRLQGNDLPRSVEVSYYSSAFSEKKLTQSTIMRTYPQGQNFTIDVPLSLDDTRAKELSDVTLMNAHLERNSYSFTTSLEHVELEAGDVITLETVGDIRIESVSSTGDQDGLLEFIGVDAGASSTPMPVYDNGVLIGYTASSTTGSTDANPQQPSVPESQEDVTYLTQSGVIPMDLPPLNSSDSDPRIHVAVHNYGSDTTWPGAVIEMSKDGGSTWVSAGAVHPHQSGPAVWGIVELVTPPVDDFNVIDDTTWITVKLKSGSVESCTEAQFLNGYNKCMVGQELIYFKDVQELGNGTYRLTHLLRGRRGTDAYLNAHSPNDLFILIQEQKGIKRIPLNIDDYRKPIKLRVATIGLNTEDSNVVDIVPQFQNFKGWRVANGVIGYDQSSRAFACKFIRRYKWDANLVNGRSNLPDDDLAGYKIAIINPQTDAILNTFMVTSPQFSYTRDQQINDFGSEQDKLKVSVVPMSKIVGPGHPTIITYGL